MRAWIGIVLLLLFGCSAPHRLVHGPNFIPEVDKRYDLRHQTVYLQTEGQRYRLLNISVDSASLSGQLAKSPVSDLNIVFILKKECASIVLQDSPQSPAFTLSGDMISRIDLYDKQRKLFKRRPLYHPHPYLFLFGRVMVWIGLLYFGLGIIAIAALFTVVIAQGCYIATMVYGSYDAPEVIVLRAFRDQRLAPHLSGRILIGVYYWFSPVLVRLFRRNRRINAFIKKILDRFVNKLRMEMTSQV